MTRGSWGTKTAVLEGGPPTNADADANPREERREAYKRPTISGTGKSSRRGRLPGDMVQKAEEGVGDDGNEVERGCVVAARRATVSGG